MSNLIPVRRMNKNGVMTTKWVRPPSAGTASSSIPAPSPFPQAAKVFSPRHNAEVDLHATDVMRLYKQSPLTETRGLDELNPQAIQAVELMLQKAHDCGLEWQAGRNTAVAFNIVYSRITKGMHSVEESPFNNLAVFGEAVVRPETKDSSYDVESLVMGIRGQFPGTKDFLMKASEEDRAKAVGLVKVAAQLEPPFITIEGGLYDDDRSITIASEALSKFIMERPEDADDIARVIKDTGTDDVNLIRDVLDFGQQSLRSGVL